MFTLVRILMVYSGSHPEQVALTALGWDKLAALAPAAELRAALSHLIGSAPPLLSSGFRVQGAGPPRVARC